MNDTTNTEKDMHVIFEHDPLMSDADVGFSAKSQQEAFIGGSSSQEQVFGDRNTSRFSLTEPLLYKKEDFSVLNVASDSEVAMLFDGTVNLLNECLDTRPETLFFLDKSARPAAYLFRETWRKILPDVQLPQIRFINIGREGHQSEDEATLQAVREKYSGVESDRILVVDEFSETGDTLKRAVSTIGKIFPEADSVDGTTMFDELPFWFNDPVLIGVKESSNTAPDYISKSARDGSIPFSNDASGFFLGLRSDLSEIATIISNNVSENRQTK